MSQKRPAAGGESRKRGVTRIDGAKVKVVKTPTVLDELIDSVLMKFSKKHPNHEKTSRMLFASSA